MATVLSSVAEDIERAAQLLHSGSCVAFPTETVYGLGANALNVEAVLRIFKFKGRPLTDPLIVHVPDAEAARECVTLSDKANEVFRVLTTKFWPGPLTVVCRAQTHIPAQITANTGWVGVRVPAHPIALSLLRAARLPVAAPSANRFGHVSPTRAQHVLADLGQHPIAVIKAEGEDGESSSTSSSSACAVGIESTVVKLWESHSGVHLTVLRRGGVSVEELAEAIAPLAAAGQGVVALDVMSLHAPAATTVAAASHNKAETAHADEPVSAVSSTETGAGAGAGAAQVQAPSIGDEAPGMAVTHYAPDVEAVLVTSPAVFASHSGPGAFSFTLPCDLQHALVLDFRGVVQGVLAQAGLQGKALGYRDLSSDGDVFEARARVFDYLRWTEGVAGAKLVLLVDPLLGLAQAQAQAQAHAQGAEAASGTSGAVPLQGHAEAIRDRLFRAASGKLLHVDALKQC